MTTFEMLQELLAQNEFELLLPEDHTANTTEQDIRLVYQMNDTVESFLVFREAIFTGTYKKDYEGKLDASYDRDQDRYVLGVRQGDSVITLFYQKLELEVNLYNYGEIAHFWVPRYKNLRQHNRHNKLCASGSVGGARPCQGRGRGFESRLALFTRKP